jgi:probable F420-dependent oxidoreductase
VVEDLSAYIIAGAVRSQQEANARPTECRTPAQGIDDGVEAERLGFRRVWLAERWDIKHSATILSGVAARTSRIGVGSGVIDPTAYHPVTAAAFGASMHCCYGPRFVLGLGRGVPGYMAGSGIPVASYRQMADYITIVRALWRGETVHYDGPVGSFPALSFAETYHGPAPEIWFAGMGQPKGAQLVAECCDGIMLTTMLTPEATHDAVQRIREACERIDRDPSEVRICQAVVTAPDLDEEETRSVAHGRAVTYLQYPGAGVALCEVNGWDPVVVDRICGHEQFRGLETVADRAFHRHEMLEPASLVPDQWMLDANALGTVDECVVSMQRWIDAGADEIATYGSTPGQNAALIEAWRARSPVA